jgi:hypothetical protein
LTRAWRYRLAACDCSNFAAAFDALPFTGALQKLKITFRFTRSARSDGLRYDKVPIRVHEFGIRERGQLASHSLANKYSMGCHVIENFVRKIAHGNALKIAAHDCQFFSCKEYSLCRRAASREIERLLRLCNWEE